MCRCCSCFQLLRNQCLSTVLCRISVVVFGVFVFPNCINSFNIVCAFLFSCAADLNECAESDDICPDNNTECQNTFGSYECLCKKGFLEVNRKCVCKLLINAQNILPYLLFSISISFLLFSVVVAAAAVVVFSVFGGSSRHFLKLDDILLHVVNVQFSSVMRRGCRES